MANSLSILISFLISLITGATTIPMAIGKARSRCGKLRYLSFHGGYSGAVKGLIELLINR